MADFDRRAGMRRSRLPALEEMSRPAASAATRDAPPPNTVLRYPHGSRALYNKARHGAGSLYRRDTAHWECGLAWTRSENKSTGDSEQTGPLIGK